MSQLENEDWKLMFQLTRRGLFVGLECDFGFGPKVELTKKNYIYLYANL